MSEVGNALLVNGPKDRTVWAVEIERGMPPPVIQFRAIVPDYSVTTTESFVVIHTYRFLTHSGTSLVYEYYGHESRKRGEFEA